MRLIEVYPEFAFTICSLKNDTFHSKIYREGIIDESVALYSGNKFGGVENQSSTLKCCIPMLEACVRSGYTARNSIYVRNGVRAKWVGCSFYLGSSEVADFRVDKVPLGSVFAVATVSNLVSLDKGRYGPKWIRQGYFNWKLNNICFLNKPFFIGFDYADKDVSLSSSDILGVYRRLEGSFKI